MRKLGDKEGESKKETERAIRKKGDEIIEIKTEKPKWKPLIKY